MKAELVKTTTEDNLFLNGLFVEGDKQKPAMIFIHGFEGDFYSHKFISTLGEEFARNNYTFLSVQTRGTGQKIELVQTDFEPRFIGSHLELLEEAFLDIDAWVKFLLDKGYSNIILSGHSLGTIKSVRYLFEGKYKDKIKKLILFAPFDKNGAEDKFTKGKWKEYVEIAKKKVEEGKGEDYIPMDSTDPWDEINISYQTYASWYSQDDIGCMFDFYRQDYNFPTLNKIQIPVQFIVGSKDDFFNATNPENSQEALDILLKNISNSTWEIINGAGHTFNGYEEELVKDVLDFINE